VAEKFKRGQSQIAPDFRNNLRSVRWMSDHRLSRSQIAPNLNLLYRSNPMSVNLIETTVMIIIVFAVVYSPQVSYINITFSMTPRLFPMRIVIWQIIRIYSKEILWNWTNFMEIWCYTVSVNHKGKIWEFNFSVILVN
jgi:hypothetical protein